MNNTHVNALSMAPVGRAGKYVYGVMNPAGGTTDSTLLVSNEIIHTIPYKNISAIVRNSEMVDYSTMSSDAAAQLLMEHQVVLEKMMKGSTVIPMKPGACFRSEDEVMEVLARGYGMFEDAFREIEDQVELDVIATWADFTAALREVSGEEDVRALRSSLLEKKGGVTIDDQKDVGLLIKSHLDRKNAGYARIIIDALKDLYREVKEHKVQGDTTIINGAFLVHKSSQGSFEEKLDELNLDFSGKFRFRCVGPLAPYNFCMIETKKFQYEAIDQARKILSLCGSVTKDDIRRAYKNHAFEYHPDRQIDKLKAAAEFDRLNQAYRLLLEYCQDGSCSLSRNDLDANSISVCIRSNNDR
jgi:hypothetical protein